MGKNKNHLFVICGKSNSGKDSILRAIESIIKYESFNLHVLPLHTTRPKRVGEVDGVDYFFDTENKRDSYFMDNKICEERTYHVIGSKGNPDVWRYYTLIDDIKPNRNYITINTPDGIMSMYNYFKDEERNISNDIEIHTIYINCDDETLINRAMAREKKNPNPNYKELMRRFVADIDDFSDAVLRKIEMKSTDVRYFDFNDTIPIVYRIFDHIVKTISSSESSIPENNYTEKAYNAKSDAELNDIVRVPDIITG